MPRAGCYEAPRPPGEPREERPHPRPARRGPELGPRSAGFGKPASGDQTPATAVAPAASTETKDNARYDLSSRQKDLNVLLISMDALRYDRYRSRRRQKG